MKDRASLGCSGQLNLKEDRTETIKNGYTSDH